MRFTVASALVLAPFLQDSQPSLPQRLAELRKSIGELRAEIEKVRNEAGTLPDVPAGAGTGSTVQETLPPEKQVEFLTSAVGDLRIAIRNLKTDLAFRKAGGRIAEDLAVRRPPFETFKLPESAAGAPIPMPPASGTPPAPPAPVPPPADGHDHPHPHEPAKADSASPTPAAASPAPAGMVPFERRAPDVPAEALTGADRVVVRVGTADIRKAEVDGFVAYLKSYQSAPDSLLIRDALDRALIPVAVARNAFKPKDAELAAKAERARAELASGKSFAEVAKAYSDDRTTAPNGGDLGEFGREDFKLPFARAAFGTEKGRVSEPFWTPFGLNLVAVEDVRKGSAPADDRVRARYILLAFDAKDANFYQTLNRLVDEAKLDVVDAAYRNAVPPRFLRGK